MEVKIFGIRLRVDFSFLVFTAIIFLISEGQRIREFFLVCLIHEFAHGIALCLCGGSLVELIFSGSGIKMIPRREFLSSAMELIILLAGPMINIIMFAVFRKSSFGILNLAAGIFNLLPYKRLDGGSILELIFPEQNKFTVILKVLPAAVTAIIVIICGKEFLPLHFAIALYMCAELMKS